MSAANATTPETKAVVEPPSVVMRGAALAGAVFVLALANFMAVLDMTIVNVAVPHIASGLAVSSHEGTWVITSYAVAEAIMVPLSGWLANRFGAVRVFCTSAVLFALASALCGFSQSIQMLVAFRILQGLTGGPLMPMSQILLMRISPPKRQNLTIGLWTMTTILAPICGPLVGGHIADSVGWPWAFYINVPIGIVCAIFAWNLLSVRETPIRKMRVDFIGLALLIVWVGAMQMMLDNGETHDWFASPLIVSFAVIAVIGFVLFVIWELGEEHPIVDLRIFRYPAFSIACAAMGITFGCYFASIVLVPLWLQLNMGYTATLAGEIMAFNGALALFMAPIAAMLMSRLDPRLMMSYGLSVLAVCTLLRAGFAQNMTFEQIAFVQMLVGLGMPFFFVPLTSVSMQTVKPHEVPAAAGMLGFVRTSAVAFATAIVTTAWQNGGTRNKVDMVETLNDPAAAIEQLTSTGMSYEQARATLDSMVQSQSVMVATNELFFVIGLIIVVTAAAIWLMPKPKGPLQRPTGGH
ncbi:DHA2 family efflux MFS transporter permease subunit [Pseudokordiimonas caeni]|uniref:DHA2 family efflux MFS transporter permease subunit n=1 Tax=Pseudokordiimonas caeni TaxID=2997908 RepID=UPI0028109E50|nr:DHA2 family efflux MFS transporter permease subunit [Pseudokordiimonas caeni]